MNVEKLIEAIVLIAEAADYDEVHRNRDGYNELRGAKEKSEKLLNEAFEIK